MSRSTQFKWLYNCQCIDFEDLVTLYQKADWGDRGGAQFLRRAWENSQHVFFISHDKKIIACCRVLSDGVYYATIHDFLVAPNWQKQGVGRLLLNKVLTKLQYIPTVMAPALPSSVGFYEKFGFMRHSNTMTRWLNPQKKALFLAD